MKPQRTKPLRRKLAKPAQEIKHNRERLNLERSLDKRRMRARSRLDDEELDDETFDADLD
jgi:hypothetical protein